MRSGRRGPRQAVPRTVAGRGHRLAPQAPPGPSARPATARIASRTAAEARTCIEPAERATVRIDVSNGDLMGTVDLSRFAVPPELWDPDNATASFHSQFDSVGSTGAVDLRIVIPGEGAAQPPPMPVAAW